ncbi:hypothetical protein CONCODRAFT_78617 [Conidiobolus coronatus NRRL 28638]|uniref:Uncharacterized protein n=1 Tax=Conidiobolus coronatus (strain ATCC 28846 / CBS 209.66 / NRRL 28638) TaxID=796925 RepID=A0A137P7E9_CONC2|nr:hypothetical protein CONCODRAFT_78617 [Conidiobolus coronatus NRRL 28638]|eukprot:KXN70936.1 hypothetical protein CONCODRAFT_78617 [Conidiobolus coronatus NRRL 28638]
MLKSRSLSLLNQIHTRSFNQLTSATKSTTPLNIKKSLTLFNKVDNVSSFREWIQNGGSCNTAEDRLFISDFIYNIRYQKRNSFEADKSASLIYNDIKQLGYSFTSSDFASLLELCAMSGNQQLAQTILNHMGKLKLELTLRHYCALAKLFNKTRQPQRVVQLEQVLEQKGITPGAKFYYQLMIAYGCLGESSHIIRSFHQLNIHKINPSRNLYGEYLTAFYKCLSKANDIDAMKYYFNKYLSNSPHVPITVFIQIIKAHQKLNNLSGALEWFKKLQEPPFNHQLNIKAYSAILYTNHGHSAIAKFAKELPSNTFYQAANAIPSDRARNRLINAYEQEEIEIVEPEAIQDDYIEEYVEETFDESYEEDIEEPIAQKAQ